MLFEGVLTKMQTEFAEPVNYHLKLGNDFVQLRQIIKKRIKIKFLGYECLGCQSDQQTYRQGFCKTCFFDLPQTADWIMHPEKSKAHLDIEERDLEYEKKIQLQPHVLYLANSSNIKVGVTRKNQILSRWIDQGATQAMEILELPNRYLAGIAEVSLKSIISDKTNWREMLKGIAPSEDLAYHRDKLIPFLPSEVKEFIVTNNNSTSIKFPVERYPLNPKSLNLNKSSIYEGTLMGLKGQYLIFDDDTVFNIRSNEGIIVGLDINY